jgi:hypothetical protein
MKNISEKLSKQEFAEIAESPSIGLAKIRFVCLVFLLITV